MKVSKKGTIFKTWEGQMNLQTFGAVKDPSNIISETFTFSVEKGNDDLIKKLEQAALLEKRNKFFSGEGQAHCSNERSPRSSVALMVMIDGSVHASEHNQLV